MKNKIFTFIETCLASAMFILGLAFFISCTKEEIVNINSSAKGNRVG